MKDRVLIALVLALCVAIGAHLAPLLLAAAAIAIGGTVLVLAERVASVALRTGWGCVPVRKARAAW
jgi:hypothetical protein